MLELLAPASSPEAVIAAVQSGADSIYIPFGGRSTPFGEGDFFKAVRYARVRGCRVCAELDMLLEDAEMAEAVAFARRAAEAGIWAVVTHDLGFAWVLRQALPDLRLHAGERLGVHNLAGVEAAAQLGFARVCLPREMPLAEIAAISRHASAETEVAVLTDACIARAGICYFSAVADRQSANRGVCTGICRGRFSMGGRMEDERPLSMNDISLINHLKELEEAGVAAVRIGRVAEQPELTALATGVCAGCIREKRPPSPGELEQLDLGFAHRRFTDGYLTGEKDEGMFGTRPEPGRDAERTLAEVRRSYTGQEARRVPVTFYVVVSRHAPLRLAAEDGDGNRAAVQGPRLRTADGAGVTAAELDAVLRRTGGTPYSCVGVRTSVDTGLELPEETLSALRRQLLHALTCKRAEVPRRRSAPFPAPPEDARRTAPPKVIFQIFSAEQLTPELAELRPDYLYVPAEVLLSDFARLAPFTDAGCVPVTVLPRIVSDAEAAELFDLLTRVRALGVAEALTDNLGHVALARRAGFAVRGDYGLNLLNSYSVGVAASAGLLSVTLPFELRMDRIKDLCKPVDAELIVYGRLPIMVTEHCLIKASDGRCACGTPARLSDNMGMVYPVLREFGCRNLVLSGSKLFLADRGADFAGSGLWGARLVFTTESSRECTEIARSYRGLSQYRPNGLTRGLYYRGVE